MVLKEKWCPDLCPNQFSNVGLQAQSFITLHKAVSGIRNPSREILAANLVKTGMRDHKIKVKGPKRKIG